MPGDLAAAVDVDHRGAVERAVPRPRCACRRCRRSGVPAAGPCPARCPATTRGVQPPLLVPGGPVVDHAGADHRRVRQTVVVTSLRVPPRSRAWPARGRRHAYPSHACRRRSVGCAPIDACESFHESRHGVTTMIRTQGEEAADDARETASAPTTGRRAVADTMDCWLLLRLVVFWLLVGGAMGGPSRARPPRSRRTTTPPSCRRAPSRPVVLRADKKFVGRRRMPAHGGLRARRRADRRRQGRHRRADRRDQAPHSASKLAGAADRPMFSEDGKAAQVDRAVRRRPMWRRRAATSTGCATGHRPHDGLAAHVTGPGGILADLIEAFEGIDGVLLLRHRRRDPADPARGVPQPAAAVPGADQRRGRAAPSPTAWSTCWPRRR